MSKPLIILLGSMAALVATALPARAETEAIRSYAVAIDIQTDGRLLVQETIDYDFGSSSHHGIVRDIPTRYSYDDEFDRVTPLEVVSVTASGGASADYSLDDVGGGVREIKVGDPDASVTGQHTYVLTYRISGALNGFRDHDELYWNAIGPDWAAPIKEADVRVHAPSKITAVACYTGDERSRLSCDRAGSKRSSAIFGQGQMYPHEALTVVVAFARGAVPEPKPTLVERWSLGRAFAVTPFTVASSGGILLALSVLFGMLVWRTGRDRRYAGGAVAAAYGKPGSSDEAVPLFDRDPTPVEFLPPEGIRPGQVGTLIDETANTLDVTATIVDLAVRGYIRIEEIPKEGFFGKPDWKLTELKEPSDLLVYERKLQNGLFKDGPEVLLSELKATFVSRLKDVQEGLYVDAVSRKWFKTRPDKVRNKWQRFGLLGLIVSGVATFWLAKSTHLALLGVPLVLGGLLFLAGSHLMPRRTAGGTAMVRRLMGFRRFIESPTQEGLAEMAERENLFSEHLPYAIVFGLTDKWARAFESLGRPAETGWYVSPYPLSLAAFSRSMEGFTTTTAGTISSVPASSGSSGFGGGGFSGGGFGGGGGGSW